MEEVAPMRLQDVERGDGPFWRLLIRFISLMAGMRLPDAARIVFYHKAFFGDPMGLWTHTAMRGESAWTVGERELMAAMTAKWNSCSFCVSAHSAIAARVFGKPLVATALDDFLQADLPANLQATLSFLQALAQTPDTLTAEQARAVLQEGITPEALEDAIAVSVLFTITSRCADALEYQMLDENGFDQAGKRLLEQGYAFGKEKRPAHPDHRALAEALRRRTLEGPGETTAGLRQAMAARAAGGPPLAAPYDDLARQIGEAAYQVSDEQVAKVVKQAGSERAAFELLVASALGAGLHRWQRGITVLQKAAIRP
jgi:uncharacterized peroxidase-related enzyme